MRKRPITFFVYPNRIVSSTHTGQSILTIASMASTVLRRVGCKKRVSNLKFEDEKSETFVFCSSDGSSVDSERKAGPLLSFLFCPVFESRSVLP
jgi:hypothetical protein